MKGGEQLLFTSRIGLAASAGVLLLSGCGAQADAAPVRTVAAENDFVDTPTLPPDEVMMESPKHQQATEKARGRYHKQVEQMVHRLDGYDAKIVLLAHMACQQAPRERSDDAFSRLAILSDLYKDTYQYDAELPDMYRPILGDYDENDGTLQALCPKKAQANYR